MKQVIYLALFGVLLAGCSKTEGTVYVPDLRLSEIKIAASLPDDSLATRSLVDNTNVLAGLQFLRQDGAASAAVPTDFSTPTTIRHTGSRAGGAVGRITFADPVPMYNPDQRDDKAYLLAYFPKETSKSLGVLHWKIDGKTDILRTNAIYDAGSFNNPTMGRNMIFGHKSARLEVICKADPNAPAQVDYQALWGDITKIELMDTPDELLLDLADLSRAVLPKMVDISLLKGRTYRDEFERMAIVENKANDVSGAGMFVAQGEKELKFRITTAVAGVKEVAVKLKDKVGAASSFRVGQCHTVTLIFRVDKAIEVLSSDISPWGGGYSGSGGIER